MGSGPMGLHGRVPELLRAVSFSRSTHCPAAVATKDKPRRSQRKHTHTYTYTYNNVDMCACTLCIHPHVCMSHVCVYVYAYLLFVCICNAGNDSREADEMIIQTRNKHTALTLLFRYVCKLQTTKRNEAIITKQSNKEASKQ